MCMPEGVLASFYFLGVRSLSAQMFEKMNSLQIIAWGLVLSGLPDVVFVLFFSSVFSLGVGSIRHKGMC